MVWGSGEALPRGAPLVCLVWWEGVELRRAPEVCVGHRRASRDVRGLVTQLLIVRGLHQPQ